MSGEVHKLVVVIADAKSKETRERWNFDIETDKEVAQRFVLSTARPLLSLTHSLQWQR